ncbi:MAG: sigma-70 family RNA polymerase sigma factor [Proteobacteria bacterium]|nr:sigma-70 family RNA polymerase sigma factor [Pseudomonadota bacterium]
MPHPPTPVNPERSRSSDRHEFVTTLWSRVQHAGHPTDAEGSQALASLCQDYWYPLYAHIRRRGHGPEEAQDLTQAFFERLLEKRWLNSADPARGRFRTFLLTALNHFLSNEWDKSQAMKRGGGLQMVSLDTESAETQFQREPECRVTPETEFDRSWALALLDRVLQQLRDDYTAAGKERVFEILKETLETDGSQAPGALLAQQLHLSEGAVRVAVHRLRQRYRELLRREILRTVGATDEVDGELRELFAALGG